MDSAAFTQSNGEVPAFDQPAQDSGKMHQDLSNSVPDMKKIMPDLKKAIPMPALPVIPSGPVTVYVNNQSVVHKDSLGVSIAFPDVCKTQVGNSQVPIPYPNIARSGDMDNGSKRVQMDGNSICLENSNFRTSMGDEGGTFNGIASRKIKGKAEFINFSFDVQVENKGICRGFDLMLHNDKNTPPLPLLQPPLIPEIPKTKDQK
jgi:hypothetical protein